MNNKTIGFTASAFDLLHAGHILMLKESKKNCDYLIVALQSDPTIDRPEKNKPIQSLEERLIQLEAVKYVDEVILYDTEEDLLNILDTTKINIRFLGSDYTDKNFTGKKYCIDNNIKIYYNNRDHGYSSTELRKRIREA